MIGNDSAPKLNTTYPIVINVENTSSEILVPILSTSTPPNKGRIMLGNEYTEYSNAISVDVKFYGASYRYMSNAAGMS